jgi:N6-adenosine-specific RNA methylase IME4
MWEGLNPPYSTILADPPWIYDEGFATASRTDGFPAFPIHSYQLPYSGMAPGNIASLPVGKLAEARGTRLFLWATNRYLPVAFWVMKAWGFQYVQTLVWSKLDCPPMSGSVAPNSAEFLLVGVIGKPARLGKGTSAVIAHSQAKVHSTKPQAFADLIEAVSPGPYVELFARQPRLGWDSWGYGYEEKAS